MNLFVAGWNSNAEARAAAQGALLEAAAMYPRLEPTSFAEHAADGVFVATVESSVPRSERRYLLRTADALVVYTGLPVSRSGAYDARDSRQLLRRWPSLAEDLEGAYAALRLTFDPSSLELLTDPVGITQIYVARQGRAWYLSNSVRALLRLTREPEPDVLGAALFLSMGWAGGAHTLHRGVSVVPGSQR